jgi:hypothetical protein
MTVPRLTLRAVELRSQVRRLPIMNRDKRLVGIVSLGDLALQGSLPKTARALHGISQPRGQHNQGHAARRSFGVTRNCEEQGGAGPKPCATLILS